MLGFSSVNAFNQAAGEVYGFHGNMDNFGQYLRGIATTGTIPIDWAFDWTAIGKARIEQSLQDYGGMVMDEWQAFYSSFTSSTGMGTIFDCLYGLPMVIAADPEAFNNRVEAGGGAFRVWFTNNGTNVRLRTLPTGWENNQQLLECFNHYQRDCIEAYLRRISGGSNKWLVRKNNRNQWVAGRLSAFIFSNTEGWQVNSGRPRSNLYRSSDVDGWDSSSSEFDIEFRDSEEFNQFRTRYHGHNHILNYSFRAESTVGFYNDVNTVERQATPEFPYMGVELEAGGIGFLSRHINGRAAALASIAPKFLLNKSDSSISNVSGIETISAPGSLDVQKHYWNKLFNLPDKLVFGKPYDSCGLHVHYSRAAINGITAGKLTRFFAGLDTNEYQLLGGRSPNHYCSRVNSSLANNNGIIQMMESYGNGRAGSDVVRERGSLNFGRGGTIEFRLFKGTGSKAEFFARLEEVHSIVEFCKRFSSKSIHFDGYMNWMDGSMQRELYPNVSLYMDTFKRGIVPANELVAFCDAA